MNAWNSRAAEKLRFAEIALSAAEQAAADSSLDALARRIMYEESAALHAWGAWMAILNGVAEQLSLPVQEFPNVTLLREQSRQQGVSSEVLTEAENLNRTGSWLQILELFWHRSWQLRSSMQVAAAGTPGLIGSSGDPEAARRGELASAVAGCKAFLERHSSSMEEW